MNHELNRFEIFIFEILFDTSQYFLSFTNLMLGAPSAVIANSRGSSLRLPLDVSHLKVLAEQLTGVAAGWRWKGGEGGVEEGGQ